MLLQWAWCHNLPTGIRVHLQGATGMCKKAREGVGVQRTSGIPLMPGTQSRQINVVLNIYKFLPFPSVFCWNIVTSGAVGEADIKDDKSIYWNASLGGIATSKNCWPAASQQAAMSVWKAPGASQGNTQTALSAWHHFWLENKVHSLSLAASLSVSSNLGIAKLPQTCC